MCSAGGALGGSAGSPRAGTVTHCPRMGRAWQVEPCGIRGAQGSELTPLWPHLAVRPGTASPASTAPLLLARLLFWGKGSSLPAPKTSPAPPAHPESPPAPRSTAQKTGLSGRPPARTDPSASPPSPHGPATDPPGRSTKPHKTSVPDPPRCAVVVENPLQGNSDPWPRVPDPTPLSLLSPRGLEDLSALSLTSCCFGFPFRSTTSLTAP